MTEEMKSALAAEKKWFVDLIKGLEEFCQETLDDFESIIELRSSEWFRSKVVDSEESCVAGALGGDAAEEILDYLKDRIGEYHGEHPDEYCCVPSHSDWASYGITDPNLCGERRSSFHLVNNYQSICEYVYQRSLTSTGG